MKKYFVVAIAVLALVAVAMPASAKVEFTYGGLFRARILSQDNFSTPPVIVNGFFDDGSALALDRSHEHLERLDQRLRLFFDFTASENLKLVTKFEANEVWGNSASGGKIGADHPNDFIVKNAYLDFNIPNGAMPIKAKVGIQGINLLNSWMIDDDFSSANLTFKFNDSLKASVGYISGQNSDVNQTNDNIDDLFIAIDYVCGPWAANFAFVYQIANDTAVSADPSLHTGGTPVGAVYGEFIPATGTFNTNVPRNFFQRYFPWGLHSGDGFADVTSNHFFDLGFNLSYKIDYLSAYVAFIKNLGGVNFLVQNLDGTRYRAEFDYTGWMVDAGMSYFCGPFTFNLGGFYTTGPEDIETSMRSRRTGDIDWFTYPIHTTKYFSEIVGGGILDNTAPQHEDFQWRGYQAPSNLWTVTLGAAWQALPSTKVSFSYWYFGTAEDVVSGPKRLGDWNGNQTIFLSNYYNGFVNSQDVTWDNDIGHELDLGITHKVVDGLMLDIVGAYMFTGDAYSMRDDDEDAIEVGARLQWTF